MKDIRAAGSRLPSLDGLRALAALVVVFAHSEATAGWPGWRLLEELRKTASGFLGVQIFFVISGFIITRLLLSERFQAGGVSLKRFWLRRFLRIVPPLALFLGCLSLMKAGGHIHVTTLSQVGSLLFFRNHLPQSDLFNAHCWSLSVEEQFYLIWPVCVAFLPLERVRRLAILVMVTAFAARVAVNATGGTEWRWLILHADCLMAGALAAIWVHQHGTTANLPMPRKQQWLNFGGLALLFVLSRANYTHISPWVAPVQPTFVSIFVAWWIVRLVSVREGVVFSLLNAPVMVWLGSISYSMYLWQQLASAPAKSWLNGVPWFAHFPINLLASVLAGALSYYLIEKPLQSLRHRWDGWIGVRVRPSSVSTNPS